MPRWLPKSDIDYIRYWLSRSIVTEKGCWEWQGHCCKFRNIKPGQRGYPEANYRGKKVRLTRKVLELSIGRLLGPKEQAGHHCDNPPCWNPNHLYPTNNQQNHLDGGKRKRMQGQTKTHCDAGHEFTPENTRITKRGLGASRQCKTCQRIRHRLASGWTKEQAESLPITPFGHRPVGAKWRAQA